MKGNKIMSQQWMKFRIIALILAAVFALTMISLPVWADDGGNVTPVEYEAPNDPKNVSLEPAQAGDKPVVMELEAIDKIIPLDADICIGDETEHNVPYPVKKGDTFSFTGVVYVQPVKDEIDRLKTNFVNKNTGVQLSDIDLSKVSSTFTTTLTLPNGLSFGTGSAPGTFTDEKLFKVVGVPNISGQTMTIEMDLIEPNYNKFVNLHTDVMKVDQAFSFTVPDIQVDADAAVNKYLTAKGTVNGDFAGIASVTKVVPVLGTTIIQQSFKYTWPTVQSEAGRDAIKPAGDKEITFTVIVKPEPAPEEEQDIVIPCPYPCQVPPMWNPPQVIQQVQPMPQAPVQNVDAAQAPIQLPKTGEKSTQPLSLFFLLSASALFLLRRKMR